MALFSKVLPKTYPELCAVYLPRAIGDKVALSKALEAINALKGCKHLNSDQKQYLDDISNRVYRYERDLPHGRGPRQVAAAKGAPLSLERPRPDHCRNADPKHLGANEAFDKKQMQS